MKVDLALAYERDGVVRMALVSGARQENYDVPRNVAATLIGELARALAETPPASEGPEAPIADLLAGLARPSGPE